MAEDTWSFVSVHVHVCMRVCAVFQYALCFRFLGAKRKLVFCKQQAHGHGARGQYVERTRFFVVI